MITSIFSLYFKIKTGYPSITRKFPIYCCRFLISLMTSAASSGSSLQTTSTYNQRSASPSLRAAFAKRCWITSSASLLRPRDAFFKLFHRRRNNKDRKLRQDISPVPPAAPELQFWHDIFSSLRSFSTCSKGCAIIIADKFSPFQQLARLIWRSNSALSSKI